MIIIHLHYDYLFLDPLFCIYQPTFYFANSRTDMIAILVKMRAGKERQCELPRPTPPPPVLGVLVELSYRN